MGNKTSKIGSSKPPKQPTITSKPLAYRNNINMQIYNKEGEIVNPDAILFYETDLPVKTVNSIILNIIDLIPINASKMSNKELDRRIEEEYRKKYPKISHRNRLATTLYQYHGKQVPMEALTIKDHVKKTIKIIINTYNRLRNSDSRDTNYRPFTIEQIVLKQSMFKKITYSSLHRPLTYAFLNELIAAS
jgi:CRISPR/Cas system CMR-associated protein Cmr5 small subunit